MNLGVYTIIFIAGCAGIIYGIRFKNKPVLFISISAVALSGILILCTFILIGGIK